MSDFDEIKGMIKEVGDKIDDQTIMVARIDERQKADHEKLKTVDARGLTNSQNLTTHKERMKWIVIIISILISGATNIGSTLMNGSKAGEVIKKSIEKLQEGE